MRQALMLTLALLVTLSAAAALGQTPEPADFRAFVEAARARGMSDDAFATLRTVASLQAHSSLMQFKKNEKGGGYTTWYSMAFCPKPDADPEEVRKVRAQLQDKEEALMPAMKKWADLDGSGFITGEEASRMRYLYEFGRRALFVAEEEKTREGKAVAAALRMPLAEFADIVQGYREIRERHGEEFGPALALDLPADAASQKPTPRAPARG